jgi:multidrug efflux pump
VRLTGAYRAGLRRALRMRTLVLLIGFGVPSVAIFFLFGQLKQELSPLEDRGQLVGMIVAPEGSTIDYTDKYARQLESIYAEAPAVNRVYMIVGSPDVSRGISFVRFKDWNDRDVSAKDIAAWLRPRMSALPGIMAFPSLPASLGASIRSKPVEIVIVTSDEYTDLERVVNNIIDKAQDNPGLQNIETDLKLNKPELRVDVLRDRAADAGVPVEIIGRTMETMLGGRQVTRFKQNGEQYDVLVQVGASERNNPRDISNIFVRGRDDVMVPLSSLVSVKETVAPRELNHFGQRRSATITAVLAPDYSLGEALDYLEKLAKQELPVGYALDYNGNSREFKVSSGGLWFTFALALLFIYLVLSAQFESFRDPFIIMLTVPLSMTGALLALKLSGGTLNVYSQIGLVTLVGLITKHGILIVEFANQLQEKGEPLFDAIVDAAVLRLRPILMTTGAMVLGAIPLAFAHGAGAESRQPIGWVIVGGLLLGTLLTLFVVPVVYSLLARRHRPAEEEPGAALEPAASHSH